MVRIKVIKASHLALGAALLLLALVLAGLAIRRAAAGGAQSSETKGAAIQAVAAFSSRSGPGALFAEENEHTDAEAPMLSIEILPAGTAAPREPEGTPLRILLYHTHTHEAYAQEKGDEYVETSAYRTADASHSVVRVGEALSELLRQRGFSVTHDTTDHEPPALNTAYNRSLQTLESYTEPFDLYIDLHRDAYNAYIGENPVANGRELARLMVLLGKGENHPIKPDLAANMAFASALTQSLNDMVDGLCRDVMVKTGRYNQHIGTPAVIIEVGHNQNTLAQALASMPYLADAIATVLRD